MRARPSRSALLCTGLPSMSYSTEAEGGWPRMAGSDSTYWLSERNDPGPQL